MKRNFILIIILAGLVLFGLALRGSQRVNSPLSFEASGDTAVTTVSINSKSFTVEIARTDEEKAQGLSGRDKLDVNTGMLFIFEPPIIPSFWMREMKFPLDFVWINHDLRIVEITKDVPVPEANMRLDELPRFSPNSQVKYVLEINAGQTSDMSIGDRVVIHNTNTL